MSRPGFAERAKMTQRVPSFEELMGRSKGTDPHAWMETVSGKQFHFLNPTEESIDIEDISHALAMSCRYNGHCRFFFSVAEHSVLIADWLMKETDDPEIALQGLLHDGSEAYITDIVRPVKPYLGNYYDLEDRVQGAIMRRFGLKAKLHTKVKEADNRILVDERAALMSSSGHKWQTDGLEPLGVPIVGKPWDQARDDFSFCFQELWGALGH